MYETGEPTAKSIDVKNPQKSDFLRFSLDLYNNQYYWESHVYLEALWHAHGRKGSVADFLKGLIKLGAAGVKIKLGQKKAGIGHLLRAKELFLSLEDSQGPKFLGFQFEDLKAKIEETLSQLKKNSDGELAFIICPDWN